MKMNNQKNANIMIKAAVLSAIILIFLCFIVIFYVAFSGDNTSEIQENGERYGTSDFYIHSFLQIQFYLNYNTSLYIF